MFIFINTVYFISDYAIPSISFRFFYQESLIFVYVFLIKAKHFSYQKPFVYYIKTTNLSDFLYCFDSFYFFWSKFSLFLWLKSL